jgi:hypothetical protein
MYNGQPLKVKPGTQVLVMFTPVDMGDKPKGKGYECYFDLKDATFEAGYQGKGLPVGKYRISVEQKIAAAAIPPNVKQMNDTFSVDKSPIIRELKDEEPIIIDLAKPEG